MKPKAAAYKVAIIFITGLAIFACIPAAQAQEPKKVPRVGVLVTGSHSSVWHDAFRQALRELGYIEGRNIAIEYRSAEGRNALQPELARELVNKNVDVIVSGGGNDVTCALMQATKTIPIVMTAGSDAVARGLISSLARPGGNVTGLTSLWDDLINWQAAGAIQRHNPQAHTGGRAVALQRWTSDAVESEPSCGAAIESAAPFDGDTYCRRFGECIQRSGQGA